jgi:hypothetical protein
MNESEFLQYLELKSKLARRVYDIGEQMTECMYPLVGDLEGYDLSVRHKGFISLEFSDPSITCGCCHDPVQREIPVAYLWMEDDNWKLLEKDFIEAAQAAKIRFEEEKEARAKAREHGERKQLARLKEKFENKKKS